MEQNLGGFCSGEKLVGLSAVDGADGDAVGGAGDEVADILVAGERGHGGAIGLFRVEHGEDVAVAGGETGLKHG